MKRAFLILGLFLISGVAHGWENFERVKPNSHVSQAVYLSSNTASAHAVGGVVISSYPAEIHTIVIGNAQTGATLDVFDSKTSTTGVRKITRIDASVENYYLFDIFCTSGIAISNQGATPADVTITWRYK